MEFLADLAMERRRLLERVDALAAIWEEAQRATDEAPDRGGLVADDLGRLRGELERRRFTIGLFGLVNRGKSTLLNALLGHEVSPVNVTPETAVPVHVDHGERPRATVHLATGEHRVVTPAEVGQWVSQTHNAGNHLGVSHLQWQLPVPLLRHGLRLVDTPGLDDAKADELYTRRTIQELQAADAGVLVFSCPPTVGATEMAFLGEVAAADLRRTLLVANLYPQHYHDAATRADVVDYVRRHVAVATGDADVQIHALCADEAWQARRSGDVAAFDRAGGTTLLRAIEDAVMAHTGQRLFSEVEAALERAARVAASVIDLRLQALRAGDDRDRQGQASTHHAALVDDVDDQLERQLAGVRGTQTSGHALVHQSVLRARAALREATTAEELEDVLSRFTREVQVVAEDVHRTVHARVMAVHVAVDRCLDDRVAATFQALGATGPPPRRRRSGADASRVERTAMQGAAVGGLVAGGAGVALVGAALGPVGLLAGAIAGWRFGGVVRRGRELRPLREALDARMGEVADLVLRDLDHRVTDLVAAVRETNRARRAGFASELEATLDVQRRCPPGSAARAGAVTTLSVLSARLRHDPTRTCDLVVDDQPALAGVRGDGLEPPTLVV